MNRAAGVFLALLAFPLAALSQQAPSGPDRTHLVSSGETLGGIAARYYGVASEWVRIFEANRDQLVDPDQLSPGLSLIIPGDREPAAAVTGARIQGAAVGQDPRVARERGALLDAVPFEPRGQVTIPPSERTVFFAFDATVDEPEADESTAESTEELGDRFVTPEATQLAAGWIVSPGESPGEVGHVTGVINGASVAGADVAAGVYGRIRIESSSGAPLQVGDRYQTFSLGPPIDGVGVMAVPSGVIEVTESGGGQATAQVVQTFDRVRVGHRFGEIAVSSPEQGVYPSETDRSVGGELIALQRAAVINLPRIFAFANLGADAGLQVGDELVGLDDDVPEWSSEIVGRFQVVGVRDGTSTLLLLSVAVPKAVAPGLRVVLDRRMP